MGGLVPPTPPEEQRSRKKTLNPNQVPSAVGAGANVLCTLPHPPTPTHLHCGQAPPPQPRHPLGRHHGLQGVRHAGVAGGGQQPRCNQAAVRLHAHLGARKGEGARGAGRMEGAHWGRGAHGERLAGHAPPPPTHRIPPTLMRSAGTATVCPTAPATNPIPAAVSTPILACCCCPSSPCCPPCPCCPPPCCCFLHCALRPSYTVMRVPL